MHAAQHVGSRAPAERHQGSQGGRWQRSCSIESPTHALLHDMSGSHGIGAVSVRPPRLTLTLGALLGLRLYDDALLLAGAERVAFGPDH